METIKDYKQAINEICHTLWVFGYAVEAVAKPDNVAIMAIKEQWKLDDLEVIANRCVGYNPKNRIKEELMKDTPTKEVLRQRLDYVFFELQEQPPFADGCNYFPVFDKNFFSINNKQLTDALTVINGQTWAFKVAVQLEVIVQWANVFVSELVKTLNRLCEFAQYDTAIGTQTTLLGTLNGKAYSLPTEEKASQQEAVKEFVALKPQQNAKRGRQIKPFKVCLIDNAPEQEQQQRLNSLHRLMKGRKGKEVALIIKASMQLGWITKPTFSQLQKEFGNIGSIGGYNHQMTLQPTNEEIEGMKTALQASEK